MTEKSKKIANPCVRTEFKVLSSLILIILAVDMLLYVFEDSLSGNIQHINSIPSIAREYTENNSTRILFLGNSLTFNAIETKQFSSELHKNNIDDFFTNKISPDGTSLWEWHYLFKNNFSEQKIPVDLVVLGFIPGHLADQDRPVPSRLAGLFCELTDLPDLVSSGMDKPADILEFLFASVSRLFVHREAIRKRILDVFIPNYRDSTQYLNQIAKQKIDQVAYSKRILTYSRLNSFIKMLKRHGTKLVFVAMPVHEKYHVSKSLYAQINNSGSLLLDYSSLPLITNDMFEDSMHLNKSGAATISKHLAQDLIDNHREYVFGKV